MSGAKYQPFLDLGHKEFAALKDDIDLRGVLYPIYVDENDFTIDGHQRRRACAELGIECPRIVVEGLTEDEKQALSVVLNAFRRHLSQQEKSAAIAKMARFGWSARRIGSALGVHHTTVLRNMPDPSGGADAPPERRTGADGKSYPATKPTGPSGPVAPLADENGEPITGGEPRQDAEVSDGAGASDDEGAGSTTHDPAPSAPAEKTPEERLGEYRKAWFAEQKRSVDHLFQFDPEELASVLDATERDVLRSTGNAARAWAERVDKALTTTLKAVN